jgi:flagellar hook-associated protein 1 FlgK
LNQLSEIIDIQSHETSDGQVVVSVAGGRPLVESGTTWALQTQIDPGGHAEILWADMSGSAANITGQIAAGKIGGWLQTRDTLITGYQSQLDAIADGLRTQINTLHASGFGLDGTTGTNLFDNSTSGAADLRINPDVLNDLDLIAASATAAGVPGDADQAIKIHNLRTELTMGGTATFDTAVNTLVSQVGYDVQTAKANSSHQAAMTSYLENYRESVSGVALDEEMVNLVKFEAAYNAAAKMISMADDMLDALMNIIR